MTEVLRDAPHRKVEGDVLDSRPTLSARTKGLILRVGPPSFFSCVAENEKSNRKHWKRKIGYQRQKERLLQ